MGRVIAATAAVGDVEKDVKETLENARAAGGEVAELAEHRLATSVEQVKAAKAAFEAAEEAAASGERALLAADVEADHGVGRVRDAMWNAAGRTQGHPAVGYVFPDGVHTYTRGEVETQPLRMQILTSRIETVAAPPGWTPELRKGWVAEVEALRAPLARAVATFAPLEAARTVAEAGYRAAVRSARAQLAKYKRDLQNLGLTEAQIHAIIPDANQRAGAAKAKAKKEPEPAG
jgi:hypothetical protein